MKSKLRNAMMKDVEFLRSNGLMDYSMLIGIEKMSRKKDVEVYYDDRADSLTFDDLNMSRLISQSIH